jgi:hypothetical protein
MKDLFQSMIDASDLLQKKAESKTEKKKHKIEFRKKRFLNENRMQNVQSKTIMINKIIIK